MRGMTSINLNRRKVLTLDFCSQSLSMEFKSGFNLLWCMSHYNMQYASYYMVNIFAVCKFMFIYTIFGVWFQEDQSPMIYPVISESIFFSISWNIWRSSCIMLTRAVLWLCLCLQRYVRTILKIRFRIIPSEVVKRINQWKCRKNYIHCNIFCIKL